MSTARRTTALAVLLITTGVWSAEAADLDDRGKRYGSAYDDPRYADLYGDDPEPTPRYAPRHVEPPRYDPPRYDPPRYAPPFERPRYGEAHPPIPPEPIYRDHPRYDRDDRNERYDRRLAEAPRHRAYSVGPGCLHRDEIRDDLERRGWTNFRDPQILDRGTALLKARRNGRLFQLKVDRCSGDVLMARPIEGYRPYVDDTYRRYRTY